MSDLTILFYSCYRIARPFASAVRRLLVEASSAPIVVVAQNSTPRDDVETSANFTNRIVEWERVEAPASIWQCYQNILIGAKAAATPFVACCEDDTLYVPEHFTHRPALDAFAYNRHRWVLSRRLSANRRSREAFFYFRERTQMAMCLAPRELLIETLEEKFAKFPEPVPHDVAKRTGWGEPGRYEKHLGLTPRKLEFFRTDRPCVTVNHVDGLMGRRQVKDTDVIAHDLDPWGKAAELWRRLGV